MTTNPIFSLFVVLSAVTLVTVSMAAGVLAQTVLQPPKKPAVTSQDSNTSAAPAPIYLHELRVPAQTLKEAKQQHQGNFPPLDVPNEVPAPVSGLSVEQAQAQTQGQAQGQTQGQAVTPPVSTMRGGGMIQRAWDHASGTAGVKTLRLCGGCVYRVRVREFMVTTVVLPKDAEIERVDLGDGETIAVEIRASNVLAIRPNTYGVDTNINIYTHSGRVYPLYVRSEGYNSNNLPDLLVRIIGYETVTARRHSVVAQPRTEQRADTPHNGNRDLPAMTVGDVKKEPDENKRARALEQLQNKADEGDFVQTVPFDPGKLHGFKNYKVWGDPRLKPAVIFRDEYFTYIQWDNWTELELPGAWIVLDGIDEIVNTRRSGNTLIVESVSPLISLKEGQAFVCIQYVGKGD